MFDVLHIQLVFKTIYYIYEDVVQKHKIVQEGVVYG